MNDSTVEPIVSYSQEYREELIRRVRFYERTPGYHATFRKTSRVMALQLAVPFIVHTDRGPMRGQSGDWLVTNHPEDDTSSDLWCISDARMKATYEPVDTLGVVAGESVPIIDYGTLEGRTYVDILNSVIHNLRAVQAEGGRTAADRHRAIAITNLEDAVLRLDEAARLG